MPRPVSVTLRMALPPLLVYSTLILPDVVFFMALSTRQPIMRTTASRFVVTVSVSLVVQYSSVTPAEASGCFSRTATSISFTGTSVTSSLSSLLSYSEISIRSLSIFSDGKKSRSVRLNPVDIGLKTRCLSRKEVECRVSAKLDSPVRCRNKKGNFFGEMK